MIKKTYAKSQIPASTDLQILKTLFSFVANEHLPVHVLVTDENNNQTIFDLIIKDEVRDDIY